MHTALIHGVHGMHVYSGRIFSRAARLLPSQLPTLLAIEATNNGDARKLMRKHFAQPMYTVELLPPDARALIEDAAGRHTFALELVDTHVCAAARNFAGNMYAPAAQSICYERDGIRGAAFAAGNSSTAPRPCVDVYDRSLKGLHWF